MNVWFWFELDRMQNNAITLTGIGFRTRLVQLTPTKAATLLKLIKIAWRMEGLTESFCIGGGLLDTVICRSLIQRGFSTWCGTKPGHSLVIPFPATMFNPCFAFSPRYVLPYHQWFYYWSLGPNVAFPFVRLFLWGSDNCLLHLNSYCWTRSCFWFQCLTLEVGFIYFEK